jgi:hypothetical protein
MLSWVVNHRFHPRRTALRLRNSSHSHFGSHLPRISNKIAPFLPCTCGNAFCNPLVFKLMQEWVGVYSPPSFSIEVRAHDSCGDPDRIETLTHFDVQTCLAASPLLPSPPLSLLFPSPYSPSYTTAIAQLICNQFVTHTFHHDGGTPPSHPPSTCGRSNIWTCRRSLRPPRYFAILSPMIGRRSQGAPCSPCD